MAGVGVKLNKIYSKNTILTSLIGFGYSAVISVLPMVLVMAALLGMERLLGFEEMDYASRELFSCTVLYLFVFSLLAAAPFNAVLSKYLSDIIYEEKYEDIMPCFYLGLLLNLTLGAGMGIPFFIREYLVGKVEIVFIGLSFIGFMTLIIVFYAMLYLSICKDYKRISLFFTVGMGVSVAVALLLVWFLQVTVTYAMLGALDIGFLLIAGLEYAQINSYFREDSGNYLPVFGYFAKYWQLVLINLLYTLGLYAHNFVFWTTEHRMVVANSFVCMPSYDMATCLAMVTNLSATAIFISRVEMFFHDKYKAYSEAVIGGRGMDIENTKQNMFSQLSQELMSLVRIQFMISVAIFLLFMIFLPRFGFSGMILKVYPCLAVGYFILFIVYAAVLFMYYFNDFTGALITTAVFTGGIVAGSILATGLPQVWYGSGVAAGAFLGWCVAYARLRWIERNLDVHIFCSGNILKKAKGKKPSSLVFSRYQNK